jgi:hypothetical protein
MISLIKTSTVFLLLIISVVLAAVTPKGSTSTRFGDDVDVPLSFASARSPTQALLENSLIDLIDNGLKNALQDPFRTLQKSTPFFQKLPPRDQAHFQRVQLPALQSKVERGLKQDLKDLMLDLKETDGLAKEKTWTQRLETRWKETVQTQVQIWKAESLEPWLAHRQTLWSAPSMSDAATDLLNLDQATSSSTLAKRESLKDHLKAFGKALSDLANLIAYFFVTPFISLVDFIILAIHYFITDRHRRGNLEDD